MLRCDKEGSVIAQGIRITQERGRTVLPGVCSRVLPWLAQTQPGFRAGLACLGLGRPPRAASLFPRVTVVTWAPRQRSPLPRSPTISLIIASSSSCPGGVWLVQESYSLMVTHLLKAWAVWLLNKRAAVTPVGMGKLLWSLPGTRESRWPVGWAQWGAPAGHRGTTLGHATCLCLLVPIFPFPCVQHCIQASASHPSLASIQSSKGFVPGGPLLVSLACQHIQDGAGGFRLPKQSAPGCPYGDSAPGIFPTAWDQSRSCPVSHGEG